MEIFKYISHENLSAKINEEGAFSIIESWFNVAIELERNNRLLADGFKIYTEIKISKITEYQIIWCLNYFLEKLSPNNRERFCSIMCLK